MTIFIYAYFSPTNARACLVGLVPNSDYSQATSVTLWERTCSRGTWRVYGSHLGVGVGEPRGHGDAGFLGKGRETETQRDRDGETEQVKRKTMRGQGIRERHRYGDREKVGKKGKKRP